MYANKEIVTINELQYVTVHKIKVSTDRVWTLRVNYFSSFELELSHFEVNAMLFSHHFIKSTQISRKCFQKYLFNQKIFYNV